MPSLARLPVYQRTVLRDTIVPDHHGSFFPLDPCLEIRTIGKMVVQELQDSIRFLLLQTDNLTRD